MKTVTAGRGSTTDIMLLFSLIALLSMGFVMVTSASLTVADKQLGNASFYCLRQGLFLLISAVAAGMVYQLPVHFWQRCSRLLLLLSLLLLVLVLVPGLGREVNGSMRWMQLASFSLQPSEMAKLSLVIFFAGYLVRQQERLGELVSGFVIPMSVVSVFALFLLLEPDFGSTVVIFVTCLAMLFFAGVRLRHFLVIIVLALLTLTVLAVSSPYRWERLTAFMNPWADQFNSGYQLTQALIAFGRGEWWGVGLGASIQKLFYLPEAHTDFILAVIGEELGFAGLFVVLSLYYFIIVRGMIIARRALQNQQLFAAYLALGITLLFAVQSLISMGVNTGLLPTKGLTLPLMSYGGSSLIVTCISLSILLRVAKEIHPQEGTMRRKAK